MKLAYIRANHTAKCLVERAAFCAEQQDNIDGIMIDARPPMPHQLHVFAAHRRGGRGQLATTAQQHG